METLVSATSLSRHRVPAEFVPSSVEGASSVTLREIRLRDNGVCIPVGTHATVLFGKIHGRHWMEVTAQGEVFVTRRFSSFFTPPTPAELEDAVSAGVCPSVLGENVEPDGEDEQGAPSWLMALGLI